jgi:hypothetical protein
MKCARFPKTDGEQESNLGPKVKNFVHVLIGCSFSAACSIGGGGNSIAQYANDSHPLLASGPNSSCKEQARAYDAAAEWNFDPRSMEPIALSKRSDSPKDPQQSPKAPSSRATPLLAKTKAYLEAMFRVLVAGDSKNGPPLFRGPFSPDKFCISVLPGKVVNAMALPMSGSVVVSSEYIKSAGQIKLWETLGHELGHVFLGHYVSRHPETAFPMSSNLRLEMNKLAADVVRYRERASDLFWNVSQEFARIGAASTVAQRLFKQAEGKQSSSIWERVLWALLAESDPDGSMGPKKSRGNDAVTVALIAVIPDGLCNATCKAGLFDDINEAMRFAELSANAEREYKGRMESLFGKEWASSGQEQQADAFGQYLLNKAGLHPALTPSAWFAKMLLDEKGGRSRWEEIKSLPKDSPIEELLPLTSGAVSKCLLSIVLGEQVSAGTSSHPPDCYRFIALGKQRWTQTGSFEIVTEQMLPQIQPSFEDVLAEIEREERASSSRLQGGQNSTGGVSQPSQSASPKSN